MKDELDERWTTDELDDRDWWTTDERLADAVIQVFYKMTLEATNASLRVF